MWRAVDHASLCPADTPPLTRPAQKDLGGDSPGATAPAEGGERKRIELAAVFAMRPKLAILDEPDSGVDTLTLGDIAALIRRMAGQGTAVLLITHRDEMLAVADSASLMCQGTIVFSGSPEETRT